MTSATILTGSILWIISFLLTEACREETLIVVEDRHDGAVLSAFQEEKSSQPSKQLELHSHLSPECGSKFLHCQNLLVLEEDRLSRAFIFVPLTESLAIVEVSRNNYTADVEFGQVTVLRPREVHCSPSTVILVQDNIFAVCTNQSSGSVFVLDIILDRNTLSKTRYTYSNDLYLSPSEGSLFNRTNFLHIDYLSYHFIIFGLGRALYSLRPYTFSATRLRDIPGEHCDSLRWLAPKDGTEFWAYCGSNVINYDVGIPDWREAFTLEEKGISFWCAREGINISVLSSYINVTKHGGSVSTIRKEGQDFVSGVCIGSMEKSFFVYVDRFTGVHKVDLSNFETSAVFAMSCADGCLPPVAIDNRYLIVRGVPENMVVVLDALNNSVSLMEVKDIAAPIITLLTLPCPPQPSDLVPLDLDESNPSSSKAGLTAGLVVLGVVLLLCAVTGGAILAWKKYSAERIKRIQLPKPENGFKIDADDGVFPVATKYHSQASQKTPHSEERVMLPKHNFSFQEHNEQPVHASEQPSAASSQGYLEDTQLLEGSLEGTETSRL